MEDFMKCECVEKKLQRQVIDRLKHEWNRRENMDSHKMLSKLHPSLNQDITFEMFESTLRNVPIFENIDKSFFRVFGSLIKERYHLKQETIHNTDDIVSEICIVERGKVRVLSKSRHIEAFMGNGGIFGNITPNARHKISVTVTALNNVDLLFMESAAFFRVLDKYPAVKQVVQNNLRTRTDFVLPTFRTSEHTFYPESASTTTFESVTFQNTDIFGIFSICLPWKVFRITIPHDSIVFTLFDIYSVILTYISVLFVIYEFAFQDHAAYLVFFAIYVDATFIFKIILDMHKTYENRYGEMVTSNLMIFHRYVRNNKVRRTIDFLINFPFYYLTFFVALFSEFDTHLYFSCLRMVTIFRLSYVFDYFKDKSCEVLTRRLILKFSALFIWVTLVIHTFACCWYLCACPLVFCFENNWIKGLPPNTINKLDIYITCVYFVTTLLTKTSTGDIVANNTQEQIYIVVVTISASILTGIFIGSMWNFLNYVNVGRSKYDDDVTRFKQYLQSSDISDYEMKKMLRYVQQLWLVNGGNQTSKALSYLHDATLSQFMSTIYGHHLRNSYIFSDVEESFARQICQYLKPIVFFPGNYIVQHGDFDNAMYFIHHGEVNILTVHSNLTETIHEILHTGDMFGAIQGLYDNVPHHFSYRARTTVRILGLRFNDWQHLLDFFPESKESIFTKTNRVSV